MLVVWTSMTYPISSHDCIWQCPANINENVRNIKRNCRWNVINDSRFGFWDTDLSSYLYTTGVKTLVPELTKCLELSFHQIETWEIIDWYSTSIRLLLFLQLILNIFIGHRYSKCDRRYHSKNSNLCFPYYR